MEVKKTKKADLERKRTMFYANWYGNGFGSYLSRL